MAALRPFKFIPKTGASIVVQAVSLSAAEKHFEKLALKDIVAEAAPLTAAEYKTVDFKAESFVRIPGGKEDATVTPFRLTLGDETTYRLATSQAKAESFLQSAIQEVTGFKVEALPAEEYGAVDWSKVEIIDSAPAAGAASTAEPKKGKSKDAEGDAKNQAELKGIPGMEESGEPAEKA